VSRAQPPSLPPGVVQLRCCACGYFLMNARDFGQAVCEKCGAETTYRSRTERRRGTLETPEGQGPTLSRT